MVQTATEADLVVDEIVATLGIESEGAGASLTEQVQRAASAFDRRRARAAVRALLGALATDPQTTRELEGLVLLGLAHPKVLREERVPLVQEGRRLAVLLEQRDEVSRAIALLELLSARFPSDRQVERDLAAMLRRTGNTDRLVDRYLSRAETAVEAGRSSDAIPLLQEILLVDRSRRDVARMIRDLRYQEADRISRQRRVMRRYLFGLILMVLVAGLAWREWSLSQGFEGIPSAEARDLDSLQRRLAEVDGMIDQNPLWMGAFQAVRERGRLRSRIQRIEFEQREAELAAERAAAERLDRAEEARLLGRRAAARQDYDEALQQFLHALELGGTEWEHREQVQKDVVALQNWKRDNER